MRREKSGKRIELTERDLAVFELLERYRYLRSTFIHAFVGGASETRFKERLGDPYHEGAYLDRPSEQWKFANARYMLVVYENTDAARQVLVESGRMTDRRCGSWVRGVANGGGQFAHTLMTYETLASIDLAATADPQLRFIPPAEILAKAPEATRTSPHPFRIPQHRSGEPSFVVPDGLFGLEYTVDGERRYRFFALEIDRATMPVTRSRREQTSYFAKLMAYRDVLACEAHKSHFGLPNLLALTVTTSERHKANILSAFTGVIGGSMAFLFKAVDRHCPIGGISRADPSILLAPWDRAGHPPQRIAAY